MAWRRDGFSWRVQSTSEATGQKANESELSSRFGACFFD